MASFDTLIGKVRVWYGLLCVYKPGVVHRWVSECAGADALVRSRAADADRARAALRGQGALRGQDALHDQDALRGRDARHGRDAPGGRHGRAIVAGGTSARAPCCPCMSHHGPRLALE